MAVSSTLFRFAVPFGILVLVGSACGSDSKDAVRVSQSASTHDQAAATTTTRYDPGAASDEAAKGPFTDLLGDSRNVPIDHIGSYEWVSPIVLPYAPQQWYTTNHVIGDVEMTDFNDTLVPVEGGYSLMVSFRVKQFSGQAALGLTSVASGPGTPIVPKGN